MIIICIRWAWPLDIIRQILKIHQPRPGCDYIVYLRDQDNKLSKSRHTLRISASHIEARVQQRIQPLIRVITFLTQLVKSDSEIIVTRDFNIHNSNWLHYSSHTSRECLYVELFAENNNLTQLAKEPNVEGQHQNVLDLFLTSDPNINK